MTYSEISVLNELKSINCMLSPIVAELHNSKNDIKKQNDMIIWLLTFLINELTDADLRTDLELHSIIVGRDFNKNKEA